MNLRFEVLAEPTRRQILDPLRGGERPVGELVDSLGLSQPAVSKHVRALREAHLVEARVDRQRRIYRVLPTPLREIDGWLTPYPVLWETSPDALEHHLDLVDRDLAEPAPGRTHAF